MLPKNSCHNLDIYTVQSHPKETHFLQDGFKVYCLECIAPFFSPLFCWKIETQVSWCLKDRILLYPTSDSLMG